MTEDDLRAFLEENKIDIQSAVKAATIKAMTQHLEWSLPNGVREVVATFIEEEIVPEVKAHLQAQKGVIVEAACKAASEIGDKVSVLLVEKATEAMTGYRSGEVIKALMGVR
jgi:hypothetical protein